LSWLKWKAASACLRTERFDAYSRKLADNNIQSRTVLLDYWTIGSSGIRRSLVSTCIVEIQQLRADVSRCISCSIRLFHSLHDILPWLYQWFVFSKLKCCVFSIFTRLWFYVNRRRVQSDIHVLRVVIVLICVIVYHHGK
jgi:hypothetical protein